MKVERKDLTAAIGATDDEDLELLGRAVKYESGEVLVPRDWLMERCEDLGVPEVMRPSAPSNHSAYKRAMQRLITTNPQIGERDRTDRTTVEGHRVRLNLRDGDGNVNHLRADVFFPEAESGVEGGKWVSHDLGHFDYEEQDLRARKHDDCPESLGQTWGKMAHYARQLYEELQERHTGEDLRNMVYLNMILNSPPDWPDVIPLTNRGLYFVPEGDLSDTFDAMAEIFSEANRWKEGGEQMQIRTIEMIDTADKREWVRERVEETLEDLVDDALESAWEALDEGDDTVDEIVEAVGERLDEGGGETVEKYNELLQAKLDVESILARRAADLDDDERQEIVEQTMAQVDL